MKALILVSSLSVIPTLVILTCLEVTAQDIAEEIVWAASRPPHVNIAELFVMPVNQASATIKYQARKDEN